MRVLDWRLLLLRPCLGTMGKRRRMPRPAAAEGMRARLRARKGSPLRQPLWELLLQLPSVSLRGPVLLPAQRLRPASRARVRCWLSRRGWWRELGQLQGTLACLWPPARPLRPQHPLLTRSWALMSPQYHLKASQGRKED